MPNECSALDCFKLVAFYLSIPVFFVGVFLWAYLLASLLNHFLIWCGLRKPPYMPTDEEYREAKEAVAKPRYERISS